MFLMGDGSSGYWEIKRKKADGMAGVFVTLTGLLASG
jgi:hypothetical protein